MAPKNLENLTHSELKKFLESFDYILSDSDGTIYNLYAHEPFPGVSEFFNCMEHLGKETYIVSNNNQITNEAWNSRLKSCGFHKGLDNLVYPTKLVAEYFKSIKMEKTVFCIAPEPALQEFKSYGLKCKIGPTPGPEKCVEYVSFFEDDLDIGAVYIDLEMQINMAKAYMATTYLKRPDVVFVAGPMDKRLPITKTGTIFSPAFITDTIIEETGRNPISIAKPSKLFSETIEKKYGISDPKRVLVIGDSLPSDVGMGKIAGYQTLFLLTTHTYQDMEKETKNVPDYYAKDINALVPVLTNYIEKL